MCGKRARWLFDAFEDIDDEDDEEMRRNQALLVGIVLPSIMGSSKAFSVLGKLPNAIRDRTAIVAKILELRNRGKFKRMYRLHENDFDRLLAAITPIMQ